MNVKIAELEKLGKQALKRQGYDSDFDFKIKQKSNNAYL